MAFKKEGPSSSRKLLPLTLGAMGGLWLIKKTKDILTREQQFEKKMKLVFSNYVPQTNEKKVNL